MPQELVYYITQYGYMAIFILVFLQEIGMPNPFPNELLLIFAGYLSFKGLLFLPFVIITAFFADFLGTNLLYFLFYNTGTIILRKKPKWFPISESAINRLSAKISKGGQLSIYIFRLTPFTRGYASVITGLLQVKPKIFLPIALVSALTWSSVYVITGRLIGPSWDTFATHIENFKYLLLVFAGFVIVIIPMVRFINNRRNRKKTSGDNIQSPVITRN